MTRDQAARFRTTCLGSDYLSATFLLVREPKTRLTVSDMRGFGHVGGHIRAGLAVLAGLALLAGAGCSTAALRMDTGSGVGGPPAPGSPSAATMGTASPGTASPGVTTTPGSGHGGKTSGGAVDRSGGSGTRRGGSPGSTPGGRPGRTPGKTPGTGRAVLFGGDVPLAKEEPQLGRTLAIVRVYDRIGERFPNRREATFMSQGSTILVSFDTFPRQGPSYASIAAGREDGTIRAFLDSVEQAAVRYRLKAIYVTFEHEANNSSKHAGLGSPADFIRAWDHVHQLAVDAHLDWNQGGRLHWVLILTHFGYINSSAASYWPGTGQVDVIAADGYNTGGCRHPGHGAQDPPVSPASLFSDVISFAVAHGRLPVFIAEWGSVAYPAPSARVNFIQQMQAFVDANPLIAAALYWDSAVPGCNYEINDSPTSLAALASMGHAPDMQGR
jgi:hypothetical protein